MALALKRDVAAPQRSTVLLHSFVEAVDDSAPDDRSRVREHGVAILRQAPQRRTAVRPRMIRRSSVACPAASSSLHIKSTAC